MANAVLSPITPATTAARLAKSWPTGTLLRDPTTGQFFVGDNATPGGVLATGQETRGAKLRRLARQAANNNAWTRQPMRAAPPWQPATAYASPQVVANGGNLYACLIAGTSAASGGPTVTTSQGQADGGATWTYYGTNVVTADPSSVITAWAASTAYALGQQVQTVAGRVYACVVAGTSAATAPTGVTNSVADGGATWTYLGPYRAPQAAGDFPAYSSSNTTTGGIFNAYNPQNYAAAVGLQAAQVIGGGSGYAVGDTITLAGGTSTTAAVLRVTAVAAGAVAAVAVQSAGSYTVLPPSLPTLAAGTSGAGTGATFACRWPDPAFLRLRGCYVAGQYGTDFVRTATFQQAANLAPVDLYVAYEFFTDAPKLTLIQSNVSRPLQVWIDGVPLGIGPLDTLASGNTYHTLDFTASSGRKVRHYRVESQGQCPVGTIRVDPSSQVWAPDDSDKVTAAFVSDSIWAGSSYGPVVVGNNVPRRVASELGWSDPWSFSQGGTGYCNRGTLPGVGSDSYQFRIPEALTRSPDIWALMGSTNDIGQTAAAITAAVAATLQAIRAGSAAPVVVFGVWPFNDSAAGSTGKTTYVEAAVQAAVTQFADPLGLTYFVPIRNDPAGPWITGTWNNSANTNSTNANQYISGDATHPPDPGTAYLARRIAAAFRTLVLPNLI